MIKNILGGKNRILVAISLILAGIALRLGFNSILPETPAIYITINGITQPMFMMDLFFVVAVVSLISGLVLGGYYTFIVPISIMVVTDLILGNNWIILFTWSGFAIMGLIGYTLKTRKCLTIKKVPTILGAGLGGILVYDIWTNFGTWLGGWYPHTFAGFVLCYTYALPFMLWHLLSTTIALSIVILSLAYLKESELFKADFSIKTFEKRSAMAVPVILMVLAIITVMV